MHVRNMDFETAYAMSVTTTDLKNGGVEIKCNKGLWSVYASTLKEAEREAKHYFAQYFSDGEYDT